MLDFMKGNDKPKNDRIKFEPSESKKCIVENEFCKIYLDSVSHQTFKVINDYVVPIELREFNMWKNRQKDSKGFSVDIIKDDNGEVFDYVISKNTAASSASANVQKQSVPSVTEAPAAAPVNMEAAVQTSVPNTSVSVQTANTSVSVTADTKRSDGTPRKRKPKSTRLSKCAICKNEFKEEDLLLFVNRNYCFGCVEEAVKEKVQGFPVDPVEKAILDITTADELYCTYSTVSNYPYIDDNGCVNVCSVSRAAESVVDATSVETIEDKGVFFDDLKRYGMKKIIVNNDNSHIFSPDDFDEHVKSDGIAAPKVYFDIIKYTQTDDLNLREKIASVFLGSSLYTLSMNDDITEITTENIDSFKPLTLTDGTAVICPVFTDIVEARNVNLSFKGLYSVSAEILSEQNVTHYIVNPGSIGYIINKSSLADIEPYIEDIADNAEVQENITPIDETKATVVIASEQAEETCSEEPESTSSNDMVSEISDSKASEPDDKDAPVEDSSVAVKEDAVAQELSADNLSEEKEEKREEVVSEKLLFSAGLDTGKQVIPQKEETADKQFFFTKGEADDNKPESDKENSVGDHTECVKNEESDKKTDSVEKKVSEELTFIPDDTVAFKDFKKQPVADEVLDQAVADVANDTNLDEIVQEIAADSENGATLEFSGLIYGDALTEEKMPIKTVQDQIVETNAILNELKNTSDFGNAAALRRQLDEKFKILAHTIVDSNAVYAQFDSTTKHIFIDGNNRGHIFSDKAIAEKSNQLFRSKGVELYVQEFTGDSVLTMVYEFKRHGIQELVVDDAANWIIISTDVMSGVLNVDDPDLIKIPITNPELMFSMTTLFQKLQSKHDYPSRRADISALERRMIREFTSARYILPLLSAEGEDAHPITLESKNGSSRLLVFSDVYEMKRFFGSKLDIVKDYKIINYNEMIHSYAAIPNTVVVLNEGSLRFEFNAHNCNHINKVSNIH